MTRALATVGLGVGLCLAAATFDAPSLYVPGVALAVLAVTAVAWVLLAARGARLRRSAGPRTAVEDEPWPLRLELRAGLLPPPGGELLEALLGWPVPVGLQRSRRVRINVRFSRRGRRRLEPARLVLRDPLRLYSATIATEGEDEVLVLPRVEPVEPLRGGGAPGRDGEGGQLEHALAGQRLEAAQAEIDGLRPYRQGAPASRIHWPAVARSGEMIERRLVAELESGPLVVLDASEPSSEEALDDAVRAAASLCRHLARAGGCAVLMPGERRPSVIGPDLGRWPQLHARLALVEPVAAAPRIPRGVRASALLWVTGSSTVPARERLPARAVWLVAPGPPDGGAVFRVAGCYGRPLAPRRRRPGAELPGREAA